MKLLRVAAIALVCLLLLILAGLLAIQTPPARRYVFSKLQTVLAKNGIALEASSFRYEILPPHFDIRGLRIWSANRRNLPPLLEADRLELTIALSPLARGMLRIESGALDNAVIRVVLLPGGSNLPARNEQARKAENTGRADGGASLLSKYQAGDFEIRNAAAAFRDERHGVELRLPLFDASFGDHGLSRTLLALETQAAGEAVAAGRKIPVESLVVRAAISGDLQRIELDSARIKSGQSQVDVRGMLTDLSSPVVSATWKASLQLEEIANLTGFPKPLSGRLSAEGKAEGAPRSLRARIHLAAADAGIEIDRFRISRLATSAQYDGASQTVSIESLALVSPDGSVDARGKLALSQGESSVQARLANVDLERIARALEMKFRLSSRVDGTLALSWPEMEWKQAEGRALLRFSKLRQEPAENRLPVKGDVEALIGNGRITLLIGQSTNPAKGQTRADLPLTGESRTPSRAGEGRFGRPASLQPAAYRSSFRRPGRLPLAANSGGLARLSWLMRFLKFSPAQTETGATGPPLRLQAIQALAAVLRGRVSITLQGDLSGQLSADVTDLGELSKSIGALTGGNLPLAATLSGEASVTADISGKVSAPVLDLRIHAPRLQAGPFQRLSADVQMVYSPAEIQIGSAVVRLNDQTAQAQGTIGLAPNAPMDLRAQIRNVRIGTLLAAIGRNHTPVSGVVSARASLNGTRTQPEAELEMTASHLEAYGEPWGQLLMTAAMRGSSIQVRRFELDKIVTGLAQQQAGQNASQAAAISKADQIAENAYRASANQPDGKGEKPPEARPAGTLMATGTYDLNSRAYSAQVRMQELHIQQLAAAGHSIGAVIDGNIEGQGNLDRPAAKAQLQISEFALDWRNPEMKVTGNLQGEAELTTTAAEGPAFGMRIGQLMLAGKDFDVRTGGPLEAEFKSNTVTIKRAVLFVNEGRVELGGRLPLQTSAENAGDMRVMATLDLHSLYRLAPALESSQASGMVNADVHVYGSLKQPLPEGAVTLRDGFFHPPSLPSPFQNVQAGLLLQRNLVELQQVTGQWAGASIAAQGAIPWSLILPAMGGGSGANTAARMEASMTGLQIGTLAKNQQAKGSVSLHLQARAPRLEIGAVTGNLEFDELNVHVGGIEIGQQGKSAFSLADGVARIERFELAGPETIVSAAGTAGLSGEKPLDVTLNVNTDLALLSAFVETARLAGRTVIQVRARGTIANPDIRGLAAVQDGQLAMDRPSIAASNLNLRLEFAGKRFAFQEGTGNLNGGDVKITGGGEIRSGGFGNLHVSVRGTDVYLDFPEGLLTVSDFDINVTNRGDLLVIGGRAAVKEGTFRKDINLQASVINLLESGNAAASLSSQQSAFFSRVRFNLAVSTPDSPLVVDNNVGKFAVIASVRLTGSYYQPSVTGRVQMEEAGQLFLNGNTFNIQRGIVTFVSEQQIRPELDILAQTKVSSYDITMAVSGPAGKITTTLTSDPPLSEADIVSVLLTGRPLKDVRGAEVQVASQQVLSYVAGGLGTALASRLQSVSGLSEVRVEPVLVAGETTPEARLTIGENLASNLSLTYSRNIVNGSDDIWIGEYNARRNLVAKVTKQADNSYRFDLNNRWLFGGTPLLTPGLTRKERRIGTVQFAGMPVLSEQELGRKLKVHPGDPFDFFKIRKGMERIQSAFQKRGYLEAEVHLHTGTSAQSVDLNIDVQAGPAVEFVYQGWQPPSHLRGVVRNVWKKGVFDLQRAAQSEDAIREDLAHRGYLQAEVTHHIQQQNGTSKQVAFTIRPGPRLDNRGIVFQGAERMDPNELGRVLRDAKLKDRLLIEPGKARSLLERYYQDHGYLGARVEAPRLRVSGNEGAIVIPISEGPLYSFRSVQVRGNQAYSEQEIISRAEIGAGTLYARDVITSAVSRIQRFYTDHGYNDAIVTYQTTVADADAAVAILFQIEEGKQQVLRQIVVNGNQQTSRSMIVAQVPVKPGQVLSLADVSRTRSNLYGTGAYQLAEITHPALAEASAAFSLSPNQLPADLHINVHEVQPYRILAGGYYDTDRGPGAIADISNRNSLGNARVLGLRARYDADLREARLYFSQPFLQQFPVRSIGETYYTKQIRPAFVDDRWGATFGQEARFGNHYVLNYGYRIERTQVFNRTEFPLTAAPAGESAATAGAGNLLEGANPVPPFSHITFRVAPLITSLSQDTRDDVLDASTGLFMSHGISIGFNFLGSQQQYFKYFAQYFRYLPLGRPVPVPFKPLLRKPRLVYAGAARFGIGRGLHGQTLVPSERFFAGGGTTIRGFKQDEVGPKDPGGVPVGGDSMFILNHELRFPLWRWFDGATFLDLGNVYSRISDFNPLKVRASAGLGLRLHTPWVLIRADYGAKIGRRAGESRGAFFVSIGQAF